MSVDATTIKQRLDLASFLRDRYSIHFNAKGWAACLFADLHEHGDTHPSMQLHKEGRAVKCWAGDHLDGSADCFQVIMLKERVPFPVALQRCAEYLGLDAPPNGRPVRHILRRFEWVDVAGQVAWHLRWEPGKPKFTWAQDQDNKHPGLGACKPTLYRLREVDAAENTILVEGERDADTLNVWLSALGRTDVVATTSAYGGSDVKPTYLAPLHGKARVYLSGDRDKVGRMFLQQCETLLQHHVNSLWVLDIPDGFKDWTEWAEAGGPAEQFHELLRSAHLTSNAVHSDAMEPELTRLALLSPAEYGRCRQEASERLKIPLTFLDREMDRRHKADAKGTPGQGEEIGFDEILPAAEPVHGPQLLDELVALFERYVILPTHGAVTLALWVVFTYCLDEFEIAPRLTVESPEKRCGKTTLLELLSRLAYRALLASNVTPAALFRLIERHHPTLLIDEMDSFVEIHEELRGILNSGHTRAAAKVIRTVGDNHEPRAFSTWCPMALACIGRLPDTVEDRSIRIAMRRKTRTERVTSLRRVGDAAAELQLDLMEVASQITRWVNDTRTRLRAVDPPILPNLHDRAADNWSPLLAIAKVVGGEWPQRAEEAAVALSGQSDADRDSHRVQLLEDVRGLFEHTTADRLSSEDLCVQLSQLEERPWAEWRKGKPLTTNQLAALLRPFGVRSRTIRFSDNVVQKGYLLDDLQDALTRYLPPLSPDSTLSKRYTVTTRASLGDCPLFRNVTDEACNGSKNGTNPAPGAECNGVTDQKQENGHTRELVQMSEVIEDVG